MIGKLRSGGSLVARIRAWSASSGAGLRRMGAVLAAAVWLGGCAGAVVGAGVATGVAAYDERGIDGVAKDLKIQAQITDLWFRHDHTFIVKLGLDVYEGRALLTGTVGDPQVRADAVRLAWKAIGVKEVVNEIQVGRGGGVIGLARDSWITTQLKSKLTFDKAILAINYAVETVGGIVYLIGIAQDQGELDRVLAHARTIAYVRKIVSHVRVKGTS